MADKVYTNFEEWYDSLPYEMFGIKHYGKGYMEQAWREAMRFCSVQRLALQSEIETLKENVRYLEEVVREEMK